METPPSDSRLSLVERTALVLVIVASILVWGVLALLASGLYEPSLAAQRTVVPAIGSLFAQNVPSVPSLTPAPLPTSTSTPLPTDTPTPLPTPTATVTPRPTHAYSGVPAVPLDDDILVLALLGRDSTNSASIWRTDTIILAFIDREPGQVSLLSIPRDLWVQIPEYGSDRINTVDALGERKQYPGGGVALLNETLYYNLGVPIDRYVRIDLQGFVDIIDAMGGVTVNVEKPIYDRFPDRFSPSGYAWITLPAGPRHMDGQTALSYCRSRVTTSDFDRSRRQQQVLVALWEQALTLERLTQAPQLWAKFSDSFETDLGMVEAVQLAHLIYDIGTENVRSRNLDYATVRPWTTPQGAKVLLPRTDVIQQVILDLLSPPP